MVIWLLPSVGTVISPLDIYYQVSTSLSTESLPPLWNGSVREGLCGEQTTVRDWRSAGKCLDAVCVVSPLSKSKSSPEIPIKTARKLWRIRQAVRIVASTPSVQSTVV